jgi:putative endonuclease
MAEHNVTGQKGEELAREYLANKGYQILKCNFRTSNSEVDIIAKKDQVIIFVEVKVRGSILFGRPEMFVNKEKRRHMKKVARAFIEMVKHSGEARFDIISIVNAPFGFTEITHFEDAFFI